MVLRILNLRNDIKVCVWILDFETRFGVTANAAAQGLCAPPQFLGLAEKPSNPS